MKRPLPKWIPISLLAIGLMQMVGDVTGAKAVKALGAVTMVSPAPRVFSTSQGLETFSLHIEVHWKDANGTDNTLVLDPETASRLRGPYNRRNVFGAILAYGPVLLESDEGKALFDSVAQYALLGERPLLAELGVDTRDVMGPIRIAWKPLHGGEELTGEYKLP